MRYPGAQWLGNGKSGGTYIGQPYRVVIHTMPYSILMERFWQKVDKVDCWVWTASCDTSGYGIVRIQGRLWKAHRWAWTQLVGPIPANKQLDHLCRNTRCVNPDHLRVVSQWENMETGNGYSARNARKTHCPQGHAYTSDNTVIYPSQPTSRRCLTCTRTRNREAQRRLRQRAKQ